MGGMSPTSKRELREQLGRRKTELVREIEAKLADARSERIAPDTVSPTDGGDKALLEAASGLDLAIVRHDIDELRAVERALDRLEEGGFGECLDCGNAIAVERLQAYPAAARCTACQTEFERRSGGIQVSRL